MCHQLQEFQDLKGSAGMNGEGWGWLVIWFAVVRAIWLGRNNMSFGQKTIQIKYVVLEANVHSWKWLRSKKKGLSYSLAVWTTIPAACLGQFQQNIKGGMGGVVTLVLNR